MGTKFPPQVSSHGGARPQTKSFAAETAAITGQSKRDINRSVARAEAIGDDLLRLTGTSLDKGVELDALARLPEPERKELIERAVAGGFVTVTKTSRACFSIRSTTKDSNYPMRQAEKRDFVPRFVPRFALRYPTNRANIGTALGHIHMGWVDRVLHHAGRCGVFWCWWCAAIDRPESLRLRAVQGEMQVK